MAVTAHSTGTLVTTDDTEHEVASVNTAGTFTFHVDLNDMVSADVVELRIYQMMLTGGTPRVAYHDRFTGEQHADAKIVISVPISNELTDTDALRFTIKQTAGTSSLPYKVLSY